MFDSNDEEEEDDDDDEDDEDDDAKVDTLTLVFDAEESLIC